MITALVIYAALTVGAVLGFFLASVLRAGASPAPTRPEALAAEPREIVAVYEEKREMKEMEDDLVMVDYFPMSKKALKWEREQDKRDKRRVR